MRILMVGDIFGRCGRILFGKLTRKLKREKNIDVVVVNGENVAHGKGLTESTFNEITIGGADIVTTGNHVWDQKGIENLLEREPFLIRPANYPEGTTPGKGYCIYPYRAKNIGVINLLGRTFMTPIDCPFARAEEILKKIKRECDIILVDFHAEATSEKMVMGFFLDGRVNAVVGTHTHVQTADERILPKGTAFITDLGMTGSINSIIGMQIEPIMKKFVTGLPAKFEPSENPPCTYCALLIEIDDKTNLTTNVERIRIIEN